MNFMGPNRCCTAKFTSNQSSNLGISESLCDLNSDNQIRLFLWLLWQVMTLNTSHELEKASSTGIIDRNRVQICSVSLNRAIALPSSCPYMYHFAKKKYQQTQLFL